MAGEDKAPKVCKAKVKDRTGAVAQCGTVIKGECSNKDNHVWKFKTGFCAVGSCEGVKINDAAGKVMKTCANWKNCSCECHVSYDQMFSMTQKERVPVDNSGYVTPKSPYSMPSLEERVMMHAESKKTSAPPVVVIASPAPDLVPVTIQRMFQPTPTGRSARGELESWVKRVCDEFLVEQYDRPCSPAFVSESIEKNEGVKAPSVGAVNAVFERWIKLGFAVIEKKPTRFVAYTEDGVKLGLDALKLRAKDQSRSKQSEGRFVVRRK